MKIDRVVFRDLKALANRDDRFTDEPNATPAGSVCIRGLNGSGKTTYLQSIASLWSHFRLWSQRGGQHLRIRTTDPLRSASLVAVRFVDLPGPAPSLWLVVGEHDAWESVPDRGDTPFLGVLKHKVPRRPTRERELPEQTAALYQFWNEQGTKLELLGERGSGVSLPNIVLIGAEDRLIQPLRGDDLFELAPEASFRFLARYEATPEKSGHIENSIAALLAVAPERFAEIARDLHQVLPRMELLNRADPKTRRPLVKLANGAEVTLEHLSAGERAALIALFTVARWMTRGGVVLIDEPELHQHLSLMRGNLALLEHYVVERMQGQLVVASHAPEVWDHFRVRRPIIDLDFPSGEETT